MRISASSYLKSCRDSRRAFCCRDFEISWDLGESLGENLGEFLATEILRSRRESRRVFSRRNCEISPRSRQDLRNLAGQKFAEILGEISVRSRSKFCKGLSIFLGAFSDSNAGFPQWRGLAETLGKLIQPALLTALGLLLKARWQS